MRSSSGLGWLGLVGLGVVGCDSDFSARCLIVIDDSDVCFDGTTWDGGASVDAGAGGSDAASPLDAGDDAGIDGAIQDAAAGQGPSLSQFCELQFATARAFLESCNCIDSADRDKVNAFVQDVLLYRGTSACLDGFARIATTTRYEPAAALACATKFDGQFALPPALSRCTAAGLDIQGLEAVVAKGVQFLAQLPECRQAFVGSVQATGACTASLECAGGLRCLPMPGTPIDLPAGAPRTCQSARRASEACATNSDCADGLVCSGVAVPGRTCIEAGELRPVGAPCQAPLECAQNWICDSNQCAMPVEDIVCRQ